MDIVKEIAVTGLTERKSAILAQLDTLGVKWELLRGNGCVNIRVPLNPGYSPLVIGAHYDNIGGSTGANDNASSCSILLRLIAALKDTHRSLEFVFFDGEERGGRGSNTYIQQVGRKNIAAMLNLDVCGYGDVIVMQSYGYIGDSRFCHVTDSTVLQKHMVFQTDYMPFHDGWIFHEAGIPTVALCALPTTDAQLFRRIGEKRYPTASDGQQLQNAEIMTTMHCRRNDSIASVSQAMLDKVRYFLLEGLQA